MTFTYVEQEKGIQFENGKAAKIVVIGVGGGGGNAINNMIEANLQGCQFVAANTDAQDLEKSLSPIKIQLGPTLTGGLGAGADPTVGREAALESEAEIRDVLRGAHMVFITAAFGGGTGTGAAPVIAGIAKELGALTVSVTSKPFSFEGRKKIKMAEEGLEEIKNISDTTITIPNDRLRGLANKNARAVDMFKKADEILHHSVKGITDLIVVPGLVNLDFADVRTTMGRAGLALMGIGIASGDNRATEAAERAISHPLLEDISISGAKAILMNITSSSDLTLDELTTAADRIHTEAGDDADLIWGHTLDESLGDEIRITVIATGIGTKEDDIRNISNIRPQQRKIHTLTSTTRQPQAESAPSRPEIENQARQPIPFHEPNPAPSKESPGRVYSFPDTKDLDTPAYVRRKKDLEIPTYKRRIAD
ncbi:cell division protein FtsZ [Desulfococcaceae bacterium OttesenSCG-928-F15]|nr:cell division protein FtsZ [Desulfococcaceae bacterium OttesenSCG-928-F15]